MPAKTNKYNLGQHEVLFDLEVPSGALCQVRRPGPMGLVNAGVLEQIDILGDFVQKNHVNRAAGHPVQSDKDSAEIGLELLKDSAKLRAVEALINKVTCYVVVQPQLHLPPDQLPEDHEDYQQPRKPERTYADSVEFEDRMFIFQYVLGGTADIALFRQKFGESVGSMEALAEAAGATE
jgi:hypothetical protein